MLSNSMTASHSPPNDAFFWPSPELPPRLLSVKSKQPENMTFGGFPLHVLYMTQDGCMRLQRVGEEAVVRNCNFSSYRSLSITRQQFQILFLTHVANGFA